MQDCQREARVTTTELLAGLSHALDLTEGHPRGHSERSCAIGLTLAEAIGLPASARADLVHAMLLKDAGCSSNAARVYQLFGGPEHGVKRAVWERDWRRFGEQLSYALQWTERGGSPIARVRRFASLATAGPAAGRELFQIRCTRGAEIAIGLGFGQSVASAIHDMDEHWDGGGHPRGLSGEQIPILSRIIGLSQVMEIFWGMGGPGAARDVVATRSGRWFDPALAHLVSTLTDEHPIWTLLASGRITPSLHVESEQPPALECTPDRIDRIAQAFALIIDGKSPYTFSHSDRVAGYAVSIAERLGCDATFLTRVRRAALVHDLGKLTIPNSILDSPQPLTADEWQVVRRHPAYTFEILQRVPVMTELALDAASHHERLDGRGYHRGVSGAELSLAARILALADVTDALAADRPYRPALGPDEVLRILRAGSGSQFCPACVDVCTPDFVVPPVVAA